MLNLNIDHEKVSYDYFQMYYCLEIFISKGHMDFGFLNVEIWDILLEFYQVFSMIFCDDLHIKTSFCSIYVEYVLNTEYVIFNISIAIILLECIEVWLI